MAVSLVSNAEKEEVFNIESIKDTTVKIFADVLESMAGAIFLEQGNFFIADQSAFRMMTSRVIKMFPLVEDMKILTEKIFRSKGYTKDLSICHEM